jgi:beta-lactamase regulating signal transducer with metallopeptidase domain
MTARELFVLTLVRAQAAASAALLLIKLDQELACDALVIEGRPKVRRTYAPALLKAHLTGPQSALVRAWTPERRRLASSPLKRRLRALSWGEVSLSRYMAGWWAV